MFDGADVAVGGALLLAVCACDAERPCIADEDELGRVAVAGARGASPDGRRELSVELEPPFLGFTVEVCNEEDIWLLDSATGCEVPLKTIVAAFAEAGWAGTGCCCCIVAGAFALAPCCGLATDNGRLG